MGYCGFTTAVLFLFLNSINSMSIDMLDVSSMEPIEPNYCNNSELLESAGVYRSTLGQFLGFDCSQEFFHCRWQSDGFRTYRKLCKTGLVYDVHGTQNCNYDYNVKSCGITGNGPAQCNATDFLCPLSGQCVHMSQRCDGRYDCALEEDEQNCPLCAAGEFACIVSEQCIPLDRRCNGLTECADGTDEKDCDVCGHGFFHCSKSNECVPIDQRCDGRRQCPHGEDEMLCKKPAGETKFTCQSREQQIPMQQVCDGAPQCADGSDEAYCEMGVSAGNAAGSSISFSSNPNPPLVPDLSQLPPRPAVTQPPEEEEYEYEEEPEKPQAPSFPMLALVTSPPAIIIQTTALPQTPRTLPPTLATIATSTSRPVTVFNRPKPKISVPHQMKPAVSIAPRFVVPVEITAPTTSRPTTKMGTLRPAAPEPPSKRIRYPTKAATEVIENIRVTVPTVRPRNQNAQQLYDRTVPATRVTVPPSTPQHALVVEVTSPPVASQQIKENVLKQLNSQLSNGMTPELMAKIERLLSDELRSSKRRRPTSPREASLSPAALIRTFSSKIQIPQ